MKGRKLGIYIACALDFIGAFIFLIDTGQHAMRDGYIPLINWSVLCGLIALAVALIVVAKLDDKT